MTFDPLYYPSPSRRTATYGHRGMVATSQPLATQAGMEMLKRGGNAVDAAIAAAAALTVVEPTANGIGGDAFALVWMHGQLHGLNASGPAPQAISREAVMALGHSEMPAVGLTPVTVPGAPSAWAALSQRFGSLPFADLLAPAIAHAEGGYAVSPTVALAWQRALQRYLPCQSEPFAPWFAHFAPNGRAPQPGEIWRSGEMADTLRRIADSRAEAFYRGELAERIDRFMQRHGGFLRQADLATFQPEWVDPISIGYRGHEIWELPPNGSGLVALQAFGMLEALGEPLRDPVELLHQRIEATKLAYADGLHYLSERSAMHVGVDALLDADYLRRRARLIGHDALQPSYGNPLKGGTVYLATADAEGNMVSLIQSNYEGFGSGIVAPGTGISLHNRGRAFSLDADHVNVLAPGKRPYHTIIPGFITRQGQAVGPFGVMGAFMQPQGHVQVVTAMLDEGLNPQAALDLPRWMWTHGTTIQVEPHFPDHLAQALARRGHTIVKATDSLAFGRGQIILRDPRHGSYCGGTEPRTDSAILPW
ncbi:gamma-glutamyltransferase family protein [Halomonas sp. E14]|uniref:gamma-glutamyltransferase family protein n=1 Tax=Halomonas sp. E14 TaxID=3397245 RepID=UPI00403EE830